MRLLLCVIAFIAFADIIAKPALLTVPAVSEQRSVDYLLRQQYEEDLDGAACVTDSECAELCPEEEQDLPPDHPDYCDGGPQS